MIDWRRLTVMTFQRMPTIDVPLPADLQEFLAKPKCIPLPKPGKVEIRCFAATGCEEHADNPPLEDHIKGTRGDNGHWTWEVLLD